MGRGPQYRLLQRVWLRNSAQLSTGQLGKLLDYVEGMDESGAVQTVGDTRLQLVNRLRE